MKGFLFCFLCFASVGTALAQGGIKDVQTKPFILGTTIEISSVILSENRILNIYLPDDYHANDTAKYPVIYLLDGSADEDFIHMAGLVQFLTFPWINAIPKSIIVGIANVDRRRDFTYPTSIEKDKKEFPTTGGSEKFMAFIEQELQPYINSHFKTNNSETIIGQSLGGLLAAEILWKKPEFFDKYMIVSPSLWWDNESLLSIPPAFASKNFDHPLSVYVAVGNEEKDMEQDAAKMVRLIKKQNNPKLKTYFDCLPDKDHATILHEAAYRGFEQLH